MIRHRPRPILYVDDTVEQRYAMRRILETEGFTVLEAGTGREALSLLDPELSLAVVDVKLPDISGYDLVRRMKQHHAYLPVLQVSASFSDPAVRAAGFSGGADAYIAQPVHPSELISLIRRMLRTSEAEESLRYLAGIGPRFLSSLSLEETVENVRSAIVPRFAAECDLYLRGTAAPHWFLSGDEAGALDPTLRESRLEAMQRQSCLQQVTSSNSRELIAPLSTGDLGFGAIAFRLGEDREYTPTDVVLAADLSSRAGLALHNCLLFASEQSTRSALIQSEKLATAGRMAAAIAHEINNPLEALTNLIYLMETAPESPESIREMATTALAEVSRLAHITRQSLGFYRELRAPSTMDLSESVRETVELYTKRLAVQDIAVSLQLAEGVWINGIKGEIRQIISNLLVNAMEAVGTSGTIVLSTASEEGHAVLRVEDDGPGMSMETRSRVFEPFFSTKQGTGTGLGLWITQAIIEKHEGEVSVVSREGEEHGTIFTVRFPLSPSAEPAYDGARQPA